MGANTKIEWTDHTFNPWRGCAKVHTGCLNCYAEKNYSVKMHGVKWGPNGTRVRLSDVGWKEPRKWNKAAECIHSFDCANGDHSDACPQKHRPRVFCASLADVFEDWQGPVLDRQGKRLAMWPNGDVLRLDGNDPPPFISGGPRSRFMQLDDLRRDLFRLIDATPNLDWLLLTKRPENVRRMWCSHVNTDGMPPSQLYRPNVWLGCSVSDQATADAMIPELLKCRDLTPVLFVSAEPLLGPIDLSPYLGRWFFECDKCGCNGEANEHPGSLCGCEPPEGYEDEGECDGRLRVTHERGIDFVIVGGESGPHARPCNLSWIRSIRDQCKAAGVPCFVKQLGQRVRCASVSDFPVGTKMRCPGHEADPSELYAPILADKKGGDWNEWPEDLRVRELPEVET